MPPRRPSRTISGSNSTVRSRERSFDCPKDKRPDRSHLLPPPGHPRAFPAGPAGGECLLWRSSRQLPVHRALQRAMPNAVYTAAFRGIHGGIEAALRRPNLAWVMLHPAGLLEDLTERLLCDGNDLSGGVNHHGS